MLKYSIFVIVGDFLISYIFVSFSLLGEVTPDIYQLDGLSNSNCKKRKSFIMTVIVTSSCIARITLTL